MFLDFVTLGVAVLIGMHPLTTSGTVVQNDTTFVSPLPKTTPLPTPTDTPTPTPTPTDMPIPTPTETPTPTPTQVPALAASDIDHLFTLYASKYGVDINMLRKIAVCESGYNTMALNGDYAGMFQFAQQTWNVVRSRMGENPDVNLRQNAEEAIKTAAYYIANGGSNAWPNCK